MPMSDHVRRIRQLIGPELLILPSVSVLVRDDQDRVLLVRHADSGRWGLIGGAVEVDERPEAAAVRETQEEAGVRVELTGLVTVLGGPEFRVTYPNGDRAAYVSAVYEARISGGSPRPDHDETIEVGWFRPEDLPGADLGPLARATFEELDWLRQPLLGSSGP
jgi:ADP-ribose pyrophosphatase YjhB (NUDIX family)